MKKGTVLFLAAWAVVSLVGQAVKAQAPTANTPTQEAARALGDVTRIQPGQLTLHTLKSGDVQVSLPEGVSVLRVPPGAKDLSTATKIAVGDINVGDRVSVIGRLSEDQKSLEASRVIVMTKSDLASAHQAEVQDWQRRGVSGVVKAIDPATKEITIAVPNTPPTPGNPTHPVILTETPKTVLLRYAPDSVKFSDAQPSTFDAIKVGDQVRALGNKSEDGSHYAVEKLVSGTFRNISATVVSVSAPSNTLTVKELGTGRSLVVHTTPDSRIHQLPPFVAEAIARLNSGEQANTVSAGGPPRGEGGGGRGGPGGPGGPGGGGEGRRGGMGNFNQMIERMPTETLADLKAGEPLIVVSTAGANPSEVTAIAILTGVEPILTARPKGSGEVNLGSWNLTMGGGEGEQQSQ